MHTYFFKMPQRIIALCGYKRCGKDTVADYLVGHYGYTKQKFASPLKEMCKHLFGFSDDQLETDSKDQTDATWNITPRRALQFVGTELMQYRINELLPDMGRLFWTKKLCKTINSCPDERHVISDLRFLHEYHYMKQLYGSRFQVIKVINTRIASSTPNDLHVSEKEWLEIPHDQLLENSGSFTELYKKCDHLFTNQS